MKRPIKDEVKIKFTMRATRQILMLRYKISQPQVSKIMNFKSNTLKARLARHDAVNEFKAVVKASSPAFSDRRRSR